MPAFFPCPGKFFTFDRVLLIFTLVFLLSHAGAYYVSVHSNGVEAIIENLVLVLVSSVVATLIVVRIVTLISIRLRRQEWVISLALPACAALLAIYPFMGATAVFYLIDQFRFHANRGFYVAKVEESDTSPKFVVFDWGSTGFAGWRTNYFLVFDENNAIARGLADPMDMPLPNESTRCSTSVLPLYGSFYSVTVNCWPE